MSMTIQSMANNRMQMQQINMRLASGNRINSAADDAAGAAVIERMQAQINGLRQGIDNVSDMRNLVRTAEGGLDAVNDGLQRARELSLQASNGILTDAQRGIIQNEIDNIMQGIGDTIQNTEFNEQRLLDGTFSDMHTAASPDGSGMTVTIPEMSVEALGLDGYDVTGDFSLDTIDAAMNIVNATRADLGAISNRFEHTMTSNDISALNLAASRSRFADADMAREFSQMERVRLLEEFQIMMFNQETQDMRERQNMFLIQ